MLVGYYKHQVINKVINNLLNNLLFSKKMNKRPTCLISSIQKNGLDF